MKRRVVLPGDALGTAERAVKYLDGDECRNGTHVMEHDRPARSSRGRS